MNFAHILCQRVIGGWAVNPSRGYFWLQFMLLLPCNATDRAEVHNLPTLEEESRDGREKVGKMRSGVAESGTAKNMTGTSSVLCELRDVGHGHSSFPWSGMGDDIRMKCCCVGSLGGRDVAC